MREVEIQENANRLVIDRERYDTEQEYRLAIADTLMILLENRYQAKVYQEISSMTIIDYTYDMPDFGMGIEIVSYDDDYEDN